MRYRCGKCGASYTEAEVRRGGRCEIPTDDGGGLCGGKVLLESAGGPQEPLDPAVVLTGDRMLRNAYRVPPALREHILEAHNDLDRVLARAEVIRGPLYSDARAGVTVIFQTEDERAMFVAAVVRIGGRVNP